jgi:tetratricopeptide (TPR) repeat protein
MKRQQILVASTGALLLLVLYFFGRSVPPLTKPVAQANGSGTGPSGQSPSKTVDLQDILQTATARLTPAQMAYTTRLENSVVRGDVKIQQIKAYHQLSGFWRDSVRDGFLLSAYYLGESAKLENSEKSLTFAAQLFLQGLRDQDDPALKGWMAKRAKELFEKALVLNPGSDSLKVGLGASAIFDGSSGDVQETMQGVQQILEVARRDSTNMYAQFMLGLGGIESGQFDKAIDRLTTVIRHEPGNIEARLLLAATDQQTGDKAGALKEYETVKKLISNPDLLREVDQRIQSLH